MPNDIHATGAIEVSRAPSLEQQHNAERQQDTSREKKQFLVGVLTLIAVFVYAFLTLWLVVLNRNLVKISGDTFNAANRPYIGADGIVVMFGDKDSGDMHFGRIPNPKSSLLNFSAQIKNFGPVPGTNYIGSWRVFFGGKETFGTKIPARPSTLFPGQITVLVGQIAGPDYLCLMSGKTLIVEITVSYEGPSRKYTECNKQQFSPQVNAFFDLGACNP